MLLKFECHLTHIDTVSKLGLPQRKRERPIALSVVFSRFHIQRAPLDENCLLTLRFIGRRNARQNSPLYFFHFLATPPPLKEMSYYQQRPTYYLVILFHL